jgi:hypothetical protein
MAIEGVTGVERVVGTLRTTRGIRYRDTDVEGGVEVLGG